MDKTFNIIAAIPAWLMLNFFIINSVFPLMNAKNDISLTIGVVLFFATIYLNLIFIKYIIKQIKTNKK
jgi:hypothetical protein